MNRQNAIHVFEVGVRDGLQNEARAVSTAEKLKLIQGLLRAGVRELELGAFVRGDRVPQMADTEQVYQAIQDHKIKLGIARAYALVPNLKGLERAIAARAQGVAIFTAATDSFAKKNIGMTVQESLSEYARVIAQARQNKMRVRAYVSTAFGCPFEGAVPASKALKIIEKIADFDFDEISVGDTIGVATPGSVRALVARAIKMVGVPKLAMHFHDTRGTALANTLASLDLGVRRFDSSVGGLGGCPFAPGATGNLATEDLVYLCEGLGLRTGIDLDLLAQESLRFSKAIDRPISSRYLAAYAKSKSWRHPDGTPAPKTGARS
jgi:hydroxymethylglutaryl-CoA lyase